MKWCKTFLFFILFVTFCHSIGNTKDSNVNIEFKSESEIVSTNESFVVDLIITLSGETQNLDSEPKILWPKELQVQGQQPHVSQQSQLISSPQGMQFIKKKNFNFKFSLQASKEGTFIVPPVEVMVGGQKYKSSSLSLKVNNQLSQNQNKKRQQQNRRHDPFGILDQEDEEDSLLGQLLQQQNPFLRPRQDPQEDQIPRRQIPNINSNEAFFVRAEVDKTEAYVGEQIFVNWYLYTRGEIYQLDRMKFPELKNFWKEDVEPAPNLIYENEIVNGVAFRKALLASYAIFPLKEGSAVVDEYKIRAQVGMPVPGFGGFSFGKPYTYTRSSERIPITIKPLPESGKPPTFSGAVGIYDIKLSLDEQAVTQWRPFNLRIRFEGEGNAKLIDQPSIQFPEAFSVFDTKTDAKFFKSGKSYKEFLIQIISKESGTVTIPPIELSYFDTQTHQYTIRTSEPLTLQVNPGEKPKESSGVRVDVTGGEEQKILKLPKIRTEKKEPLFYWLKGPWALFIWILLEILIFVILLLSYKIISRKPKDGSDLKILLKIKEDKFKKLMNKKDFRGASAEVLNMVSKILSGVSDEGLIDTELTKRIEQLTPSMKNAVGDEIIKLSDRWQTLAFAPEEVWGDLKNEDRINGIFNETKNCLVKLIDIAFETEQLSKNEV